MSFDENSFYIFFLMKRKTGETSNLVEYQRLSNFNSSKGDVQNVSQYGEKFN